MAGENKAPPRWPPPDGAQGPHDLALDAGTAYVRVFARGRGLVADEPSLVRVWRSPLAVESVEARARAPHGDRASFPVQPLSRGVVRHEESAGWLLTALVRRAWGLNLVPPRVLACAGPSSRPWTGWRESCAKPGTRCGAPDLPQGSPRPLPPSNVRVTHPPPRDR